MSLRSFAAAAALVVGLVLPSLAVAAYTTGAVNLRTGPGTGYRVITTAPPGAYVRVHDCVPRWCRISFRGIRGWMSSGYIAQGPRAYRPVGPRIYVRPLPAPPPFYYYRRWPGPYHYHHRGPWRRW